VFRIQGTASVTTTENAMLADLWVLPINFAVELEAARDSSDLETLLSSKLLNFGNFIGKAILARHTCSLFRRSFPDERSHGFRHRPYWFRFLSGTTECNEFFTSTASTPSQLIPETSLRVSPDCVRDSALRNAVHPFYRLRLSLRRFISQIWVPIKLLQKF
jgi:hypothetical protein